LSAPPVLSVLTLTALAEGLASGLISLAYMLRARGTHLYLTGFAVAVAVIGTFLYLAHDLGHDITSLSALVWLDKHRVCGEIFAG